MTIKALCLKILFAKHATQEIMKITTELYIVEGAQKVCIKVAIIFHQFLMKIGFAVGVQFLENNKLAKSDVYSVLLKEA